MESDPIYYIFVLSLPGVVVGGGGGSVVSSAVAGSIVGGGSALHSSTPQQSTLQDSTSPVRLRLLHTKSDEQRPGGKHTLITVMSLSFRAVTVEQLNPGSQVSSSSSVAQSESSLQMKHRRRGGESLPTSAKTN